MYKFLAVLAFLCSYTVSAQLDLSYYLPNTASYDPAIPKPKDYLGFEVGYQHALPHEIISYCKEVAKVSDRIKVETYARTYENRELLLLTISSPENLSKIESIKHEHQKLSEPSLSKNLDLKSMPGVIWLGYSVHGNEASGTNSALLSVYYLAAAKGPAIDSLLKENVILIDPCINPDGGTRFASWVDANKSQTLVSDINSREFRETWPGGRTNHYWFDLNRDWLYQMLPESRGRLKKYYDWLPNVLTDHHEMGSNSSFFFQPGIPSRMHPLTPKTNLKLTQKIGTYHAAGLDKLGSLYYTEENYDDFYYGKGSTLPDVNGSIGILFEQASSRGHLQQTTNGPLSFAFTVRNQFSATLSTLKAAKEMRADLLQHMRDFYAEKPSSDVGAYVFGTGSDHTATLEMVNVLQRNHIKVYELGKNVSINNKEFIASHSYVVPSSQPRHRLVKSFFEKRTTFEDSAFYDISAWTLPLCMNIPYAESSTELVLGKEIKQELKATGSVNGKSDYAYVFDWTEYYSSAAVVDLLNQNLSLKYATSPFTIETSTGPRQFSYGSVVLRPEGKNIDEILQNCAKTYGIAFHAVKTGLTPVGIDLGSEKFRTLQMPKPLMIVGEGIDNLDAGEIWHLLDTRLHLPLTFADQNRIAGIDLHDYTHIIMPNGRYTDMLPEDKLKGFLQKGGTIIAMGDGIGFLNQKKISTLSFKAEANQNTNSKRPFDTKNAYDGALETSGAIVEAIIDKSHPLFYGYEQEKIAYFKVNNLILEDNKNPYNNPAMLGEKPLMAGYIHKKNIERFKNSPLITTQNIGAGKIISIPDNPNFRAFWWGTNKIFLNGLFFSSALSGLRFGDE
jgi:hypothetical protein